MKILQKGETLVYEKFFTKKALNFVVKTAAKNSANSTTSGAMFQPKVPAALKKLSKIENDK